MDRRFRFLVTFSFTVVLVLSGVVNAADVTKYSTRGDSATVTFQKQLSSCESAYFTAQVNDNMEKQGSGKPIPVLKVFVYGGISNYCMLAWTGFGGEANLKSAEFEQSGLNSAKLTKSFAVDSTGGPISVQLDLEWASYGETYSGKFVSHQTYGSQSWFQKYQGTQKDATVTGSAVVNGENWTAGVMTIPPCETGKVCDPFPVSPPIMVYATLASVKSGYMTIIK